MMSRFVHKAKFIDVPSIVVVVIAVGAPLLVMLL
jgi:hypothetical protein